MIALRRSEDRGHFNHGWLESYHSFSFADYHDPAQMGFRALRVINEDKVQPSKGFGTHPHANMEIITYVLSGSISHKDSLGTGSTIVPGEIQRMSAGTGIRHSEFNASATEMLHLLQIWILPKAQGDAPGYEQKKISFTPGAWSLLVSPTGREGSVRIGQDVLLWAVRLEAGKQVNLPLTQDRFAWVQVAKGQLQLAGQSLGPGDGASLQNEGGLGLRADTDAEVLFFDLG